jgi:sugar phosphate isomerase/epimerase
MRYTRREFGKTTLAALPALGLVEGGLTGTLLAQGKPNSMIHGVQVGVITYSFRQMPDQSAEATLKYCLQCGISAIELMGGPAESYAGSPAAAGRGGSGRGAGGTPPAQAGRDGQAAAAAGPGGGRGGGRGGRAALTPEQVAAQQAAQTDLRNWRLSVSMDKYKALRKMYNDAGVTIYAVKILNPSMSDAEMEYVFNVAETLGCTHTTLELIEDAAQLKRIGDYAQRRKIYAAYHTHAQGTITVFDQAFAFSKGNMANVDFGHYVAGGGGNPVLFLEKFHDRISSFHLKDRTTPEHQARNLPWGTGDTPIKEILQTVKKNKWKMPASIEVEYAIPEGSDAVQETIKCFQYCKDALA